MAETPTSRARSRVVTAVLAAAAVAAGGAGFWAIRGGPGDASPNGDDGRGGRAAARANASAAVPAVPLREPDTGDPMIGAFDRRIRAQLASHPAPSRALSGSLAIDAEDLIWRERSGVVFARTAAFSAHLALEGLGQGDIQVREGVLTGTEVNLRESPAGWNHDVVLADLLDGNDRGPRARNAHTRVARLEDITIRGGTLRVRTLERSFALERLNAQLSEVAFSAPSLPEPRIVVARAAADVGIPDERPIPLTIADGTARVLTDTVAFDIDQATVQGARLADIRGDWSSSIPVFGILAQGRAVDVSLESVQRFLPDEAPGTGTASFAWSIEESAPPDATKGDLRLGRIDIVLSDLDFMAEGSDVTGGVAVQVGENADRVMLLEADLSLEPLDVRLVEIFAGPLPFAGTATGTVRGPADDLAFDLAAHLTVEDVADPLIGSVTGRIGVTPDEGIVLQSAEAMIDAAPLAALRRWAPGLPLAGTASGRVTLSGLPWLAPLSLNLDLALAAGDATVAGMIDLTGATPAYDLTGTLTGIDVEQLMEPDAPPVLVDAQFALEGSGISAEANASMDLDGDFRGWRAAEGDGFAVNARVRDGVLSVDTAWARLANAAASTAGQWRFIAPGSGDVRYSATIASLEPWGPYLPRVGDSSAAGEVDLTGTLEGSLDRPLLSAQVHGSELRLGAWAASTLEAAYAVRLGGAVPRGAVEVRASGVETPLADDYRSVALGASLVSTDLTFALDAERPDDRGIVIEATGNIPDVGPREVVAERVDIDLGDNRWSLTEPAAFRWNGGAGLVVDRFEMREDAASGLFRAAGKLLPLDDLDVEVEVVGLPVEELEDLLGRERVITGELGLIAQIEGPGSAPTADVEFQLENGSMDGVAITRFDGTLAYAANRLTAAADAAIGPGTLELDLELPVVIDLSAERKFALGESGPVSGSLVARSVSITPLQRLTWRIQDLSGQIDGQLEVAGSIADPNFAGELVLAGGGVRVPELRREFSNIGAQIVLDGSRASIASFQVESDGVMTASGDVTFDGLAEPVADLTLSFDEFRPLGVPGGRQPAAVFGSVSIDGPIDEIVISGDVRVADGDVVIPSSGPADADDMFGDLPELTADGAPAGAVTAEPPAAGVTIEDLVVRLDSDVWVDAEAARAQLSGELVLNQTGEALEIEGTLAGERGTFTLEAGPIVRRFEILSAELTFRPEVPEINPTIDVLARRFIYDPGDRQIDVEIRIGGTLRRPTLGLASPGAPSFAQPELLSILLFDRPSLEPGSGQVAGEVLEGSIAELASLELEQALVRDIGMSVDVFQVRFGGGGIGGFGNPTFVIGVELERDVFLTAETALGGLFSGTDATTNAWAIRVEWAFRRNSRLRASLEPVVQSTFLRGFDLGFEELSQRQQLSFDLRRRWSY